MSLVALVPQRSLTTVPIAAANLGVLGLALWKSATVPSGIAFAAFGFVLVWIVANDLGPKPATTSAVVAAGVLSCSFLTISAVAADASSPLPRAFGAGVAMAVVLAGLHVLHPEGLGGRTILVGAIVAVFVGSISWAAVWLTFALASVLAGVATCYLVLRRRASLAVLLPTSPFLATSALVAVVLLA